MVSPARPATEMLRTAGVTLLAVAGTWPLLSRLPFGEIAFWFLAMVAAGSLVVGGAAPVIAAFLLDLRSRVTEGAGHLRQMRKQAVELAVVLRQLVDVTERYGSITRASTEAAAALTQEAAVVGARLSEGSQRYQDVTLRWEEIATALVEEMRLLREGIVALSRNAEASAERSTPKDASKSEGPSRSQRMLDAATSRLEPYAGFLEERDTETLLVSVRGLRAVLTKAQENAKAAAVIAVHAELESGQIANRDDEDGRRRIPLMLGWITVALLVAIDYFPARLSATAFGQDDFLTNSIAVILVIALAAAIAISAEAQVLRGIVIAATLLGLTFTGLLRGYYLVALMDDANLLSAALQAAAVVAFTGLVFFLATAVIIRTKTWSMDQAERRTSVARRRSSQAARRVSKLDERATVSLATYLARATAYAGRRRLDEQTREFFLARVNEDIGGVDNERRMPLATWGSRL